jgi:hypothetical protein
MPTIGNSAKPGASWHGYGGSSYPNQEAELLAMPKRGRILTLGAWIGGWDDAPRCRLCVWAYPGRELLASSTQFTVANRGTPGAGKVDLYVHPMEVPPELPKGASFYAGFARDPDDAHQVSNGASGTGPHWEGRSFAAWPGNLGERPEGISEEVRRIGCYVANYETLPGMWIHRSGAFVEADAVQIYRGGAWVDADAVQIYRGGVWVDAE